STLVRAASATTRSRSGSRSAMSSVCVPIEPVEPSMTMFFMGALTRGCDIIARCLVRSAVWDACVNCFDQSLDRTLTSSAGDDLIYHVLLEGREERGV